MIDDIKREIVGEVLREHRIILMGVAAMVGSWYGAKLTGKVSLNALILTMSFVLLGVGLLLAYRGAAPLIR